MQILESLVPILIENIDATNSDLSVVSLRVVSEISILMFHAQELNINEDARKQLKSLIENLFVDK